LESADAGEPVVEPASSTAAPNPEGSCSFCGNPIHDEFCTDCGAQRKIPQRDHVEIEREGVAGVTDRGNRHTRNEDAMTFSVVDDEKAIVVVVCDGTSTAQNSDLASQAACDAAHAVLVAAVKAGSDISAAMKEAVQAAQIAVLSVPYNKAEAKRNAKRGAPACTLSAAVIMDGIVTVGQVGDSRTYFIGTALQEQLSQDDSWAQHVVAAGEMTHEQAMADAKAHSIVEWLGSDNEPEASVRTFVVPEKGYVLAVSDGLWNYADAPAAVAKEIGAVPDGATPLAIAAHLVDFAKNAGGVDNITVVVVPVFGPTTA